MCTSDAIRNSYKAYLGTVSVSGWLIVAAFHTNHQISGSTFRVAHCPYLWVVWTEKSLLYKSCGVLFYFRLLPVPSAAYIYSLTMFMTKVKRFVLNLALKDGIVFEFSSKNHALQCVAARIYSTDMQLSLTDCTTNLESETKHCTTLENNKTELIAENTKENALFQGCFICHHTHTYTGIFVLKMGVGNRRRLSYLQMLDFVLRYLD